jgi:hypothetical protein
MLLILQSDGQRAGVLLHSFLTNFPNLFGDFRKQGQILNGGTPSRRMRRRRSQKGNLTMKQIVPSTTAAEAGTIATAIPATTGPELGEPRCPNGHDSAIPPRCPALMFVTCSHYNTEATWNEFCITCGVRHAPFRIYWHAFRMDDRGVQTAKNYCGYCGAKMVRGRA